jgi:tricorn protease
LVEGVGVTPDLEVDNPPRATAAGGDAQLQAAVATLLKQLPANPPTQRTPSVRAYPDLKR